MKTSKSQAGKSIGSGLIAAIGTLILLCTNVLSMYAQMEMIRREDGSILKTEFLHEENYSWSTSHCKLLVNTVFEHNKWAAPVVVLGAQQYFDVTTQKQTYSDPMIVLFEGSARDMLAFLNQCEQVIALKPVFEDKHIMGQYQVYVSQFLGGDFINIYIGEKGWVTIGAKAIKRIKKPLLRWARKQRIELVEHS